MAQILAVTGQALANAFIFTYGFLTLGAALFYTAFQKESWAGRSEQEKKQFLIASKTLWSLSHPDDHITHNFLTLPDGLQLHYLGQRRSSPAGRIDALIILLHGFPDSAHIWSRALHAAAPTPRTKVVALDLPGCGGSDSLDRYGPDEVLNAVAEAIVQLKRKYLGKGDGEVAGSTERRKCVLVGHDWGGVISYRLAAETTGLLDNVVVMNSVYSVQAAASIAARLSRGMEAFREWWTRFYEFSKLEETGEEMGPVFSQLNKSSYIFLVALPFPWIRAFPALSDALVRYCHRLTHAHIPQITDSIYANSLALSNGPSEAECTTALPSGQRYGASVLSRAQTRPAGDWHQRIRLYKDNAASGRWTPTYSTATPDMWRPPPPPTPPSRTASTASIKSVSSAGTATNGHPVVAGTQSSLHDGMTTTTGRLRVRAFERFKCPLDIIYGMRDVALDPRITLDGIEEYFVRESRAGVVSASAAYADRPARRRITKLPECGHWALTEDEGVAALGKVLGRIVGEE